MKKRKSSTPLIISLVAIVLIALGFNGLQQGLFNDLLRQRSNTSSEATPATANANSVATQTKSALSAIDDKSERSAPKTPDADGKALAAKKMREQNGGRPFMAMAPSQIPRPTPNDSSISTQWYTDKARKPQ
ncbi:MAG: hypothetical protein SFX74_13500 [Fimbriimonadaceae bacterium]|nr:hypothetical protein [Fimbriimonadaceae bacterium]